jgi:hypothetical protein
MVERQFRTARPRVPDKAQRTYPFLAARVGEKVGVDADDGVGERVDVDAGTRAGVVVPDAGGPGARKDGMGSVF